MFVGIPFIGDLLKGKGIFKHVQKASDIVDRIHYQITPWMLTFFAVLVGSKMNFGEPISCMLPAEVDGMKSWNSYMHQYCFFSGKYRYNHGKDHINIMSSMNASERDEIRRTTGIDVLYYQWIPFFFIFQMVLFLIPNSIWTIVQQSAVLDVGTILDEVQVIRSSLDLNERQKRISALATHLFNHFQFSGGKKPFQRPICSIFLKKTAALWYLTYKMLNILNVVIQLLLMTLFLGVRKIESAIVTFTSIFDTHSVEDSAQLDLFPRTVLCDVYRRDGMKNTHTFTFQCILAVNYINEKLFLFLWCWLCALLVISFVNLIMWFARMIRPSGMRESLKECLKNTTDYSGSIIYKTRLSLFFNELLGMDGVFLFRFIRFAAGSIVETDLLQAVWEKYARQYGLSTIEEMVNNGKIPSTPPPKFRGMGDSGDYAHTHKHLLAPDD